MLLVIDVGNTQTAIGVYEGESLDRMWRVATNRDHTADELRVKLLPLLQSENLQASDITGAALASGSTPAHGSLDACGAGFGGRSRRCMLGKDGGLAFRRRLSQPARDRI